MESYKQMETFVTFWYCVHASTCVLPSKHIPEPGGKTPSLPCVFETARGLVHSGSKKSGTPSTCVHVCVCVCVCAECLTYVCAKCVCVSVCVCVCVHAHVCVCAECMTYVCAKCVCVSVCVCVCCVLSV